MLHILFGILKKGSARFFRDNELRRFWIKNLMQIIFTFISLMAFSLAGLAATPAEALAQRLLNYKTIQGTFEQRLSDANNEVLQSSSGYFTVKSPGYFYWKTQTPFPQLLVSNLETIWLYDEDLEQVTVRPYSNSVDQSPALLLSGNVEQIQAHYRVEAMASAADGFVLLPLANDSQFVELRLVFEGDTIKTMTLIDRLEQTTIFTLSDIQLNASVDEDLFNFVAPKGTDVLYQ